MVISARRNWTVRQQGKRKEILNVAIELFCQMGYQGMSMDALVERVGGSKSTIYSYFGDKEGLYCAAMERFSVLALEKNGEALNALDTIDDDNHSVEKALSGFFEGLLRATTTPEFSRFNALCVASRGTFPQLARNYYSNGPGRSESRVAGYLEAANRDGLLDIEDPKMAAAALMGAVRANHLWSRLFETDKPALTEDEIRRHVSYCIRTFILAHAA